jgi:hypothetical protein
MKVFDEKRKNIYGLFNLNEDWMKYNKEGVICFFLMIWCYNEKKKLLK